MATVSDIGAAHVGRSSTRPPPAVRLNRVARGGPLSASRWHTAPNRDPNARSGAEHRWIRRVISIP
jgi:hypothetical protein